MFILLEIYHKCLNIIKIIHWLKLEEELFYKNSVKAGLVVCMRCWSQRELGSLGLFKNKENCFKRGNYKRWE